MIIANVSVHLVVHNYCKTCLIIKVDFFSTICTFPYIHVFSLVCLSLPASVRFQGLTRFYSYFGLSLAVQITPFEQHGLCTVCRPLYSSLHPVPSMSSQSRDHGRQYKSNQNRRGCRVFYLLVLHIWIKAICKEQQVFELGGCVILCFSYLPVTYHAK